MGYERTLNKMEVIMKTKLVCKKCESNNFYVSLSERMNTIFELKDGTITKRDTAYPDDGEINYVKCSKCDTDMEDFEEDKIILLTLNL